MNVTFLLDENMPFALIDFLSDKGFSVSHLKKIGQTGIKNGEVYELAEEMSAWIVTRDGDFQNMKRFLSHHIKGIILFAMSKTKTPLLLETMQKVLERFQDRFAEKHLIIIEDEEIKIY